MAEQGLASRVSQLEAQMRHLQSLTSPDWRRAVATFTGDEDLQSIFAEAGKLRAADRRAAAGRRRTRRKRGK